MAAKIYYYDIGDYLTREEKLKKIKDAGSITHLPMEEIVPNEHGDWINQRNENFGKWIPIEPEKKFDSRCKSWFVTNAVGVSSGRDAWVYGFGKDAVTKNMQRMVKFYNGEIGKGDPSQDAAKISWTVNLKRDLERGTKHKFKNEMFVEGVYRPFCKQCLYYDRDFVERPGLWSQIFPDKDTQNLAICVSGVGASKAYTALIADKIPCYDLTEKSQCFPLYYYEEADSGDMFASDEPYVRRDAVSDYILKQARTQYGNAKITKEDLFYYVYGFLHSPEYRTAFAADLKKMLPRIPLVESAADFRAFVKAGRALADLHLNYEKAKPCAEVRVVSSASASADLPIFSMAAQEEEIFSSEPAETLYRVTKMRFAKSGKGGGKSADDKSRIVYNEKLTVAGVPLEAYDYVVNGKSAIEWIMERYAVTVDKDSGIKNDPNDWAKEHGDSKYIFNLLLRVITVSLETVKIVKSLPKLKF